MNPINPKRILFIEANVDGTIGGSHYCLLELVKGLNKNRFKPFILFYQENILIPEFKEFCPVIILDKIKGLVIKRDLPRLYTFVAKIPFLPYFLHLFQQTYNFLSCYLNDLFKIIHLLSKLKIDLVHINNSPTFTDILIACKFLRIKCISHLRGTGRFDLLKIKLIKFYDAVVSISKAVTENAKNQDVDITNFVLIYDGIDVETFLNRRKRQIILVRKQFQEDIREPLIGVINNIKDWKGQHVAIEALRILKNKYPSLTFLLVGNVSNLEEDTKYFSYLKELVTRYELLNNIIFTGYRKDVIDIISALDILLHTSLANEGFPRIILEIMLLSKPLIASKVGPTVEMIEDEITGFLVPPNNPEALAKKIEYLISHPDIGKKVGQMARRRVKECFGIETNVRKTEQVYNQLLL